MAHKALFRTPSKDPIVDGFFVSSTLGGAPVEQTDVPTIQMPTQFEVNGTVAYRRPDSDTPSNRFRIYEVAGMSHMMRATNLLPMYSRAAASH